MLELELELGLELGLELELELGLELGLELDLECWWMEWEEIGNAHAALNGSTQGRRSITGISSVSLQRLTGMPRFWSLLQILEMTA